MWFTQSKELLGSLLEITLSTDQASRAEELFSLCFERLAQFHEKYSRFNHPNNTLATLNSHIGEWQEVDEETFDLLERAADLRSRYGVAYSLATKEQIERLGYDSNYSFVSQGPLVHDGAIGYETREPRKVFVHAELEFWGFGKWHALDLVTGILRAQGVENFCLNFGWDIAGFGLNPEGRLWLIALEHPTDPQKAIGKIELNNQFLAVSWPSKRKWWKNGELHHLIDPKTGTSANYWQGTYVVWESGFLVDSLATGIFCTSPDHLSTLVNELQTIQFLLVDSEGRAWNHDFRAELF